MKNLLLILALLCSASLYASQEISLCAMQEVIAKGESQLTYNPMENMIYGWGRAISVPGQFTCGGGFPTIYPTVLWGKQHVCMLRKYIPSNGMSAITPTSPVTSADVTHTIVNPANGIWFVTNGYGFDQAGMDWCTG